MPICILARFCSSVLLHMYTVAMDVSKGLKLNETKITINQSSIKLFRLSLLVMGHMYLEYQQFLKTLPFLVGNSICEFDFDL